MSSCTQKSPLAIDDEHPRSIVAVVEAGVFEGFQHLVGADGEDGGAASAGDVAERMGEKRFADADGADDRDVRVCIEEAERRELVEQRPVEGDLRGGVPGLESHGGIEVGFLDAQRHGQTLPACDFVTEHLQEQILVGQLLLARQCQPLGERVEHARQLQPSQHGFQIGTDHIGRGH